MVIRSRARFRLAVHFLMLAVVTAGSASAVAAGEKEIQLPACDRPFGTLSVVEPEQKRIAQRPWTMPMLRDKAERGPAFRETAIFEPAELEQAGDR